MRDNNKARVKRGALGNRTNAASDKRDVTQAPEHMKGSASFSNATALFLVFLRKQYEEKKKILWIDKKHALE